jgi:hypothetical protein
MDNAVYKLPETEQGLMDFIRYAKDEIAKSTRREKKLAKLIQEAHLQLTIKAQRYDNTQSSNNELQTIS